jgi:hypothetical protein
MFPPWLHGIEVLDVPLTPNGASIGIVRDVTERTSSASLSIRSTAFSLLEPTDQERRIEGWGDVLAAFCTERSAVASVRVTESTAPGTLAAHRAFLQEQRVSENSASEPLPASTYEDMLAVVEPLAMRHESLVTVTVDERRARGTGRERRSGEAAARLLSEELRLLTLRAADAGLVADVPLSAAQVLAVIRRRLDPAPVATGRRSLAAMAGLVAHSNGGPVAARSEWSSVQVDSTFHRAYWIAEWPRLDVPCDWLEPLLLHAGGPRVVSIHCEPVSPSRSRRRVNRDSTRLSADEEQRTRHGFRIGASHRRSQSAVVDREAELVSGFAEFEYAGFLVVSAPDHASLGQSCAEYEQTAAQCGLELRALDGRHDRGLVLGLPVGRGLARRRWL